MRKWPVFYFLAARNTNKPQLTPPHASTYNRARACGSTGNVLEPRLARASNQNAERLAILMTLRERLEEEIVEAMRGRERVRLEALRFLKSVVQLAEKDQKKTLDDPGMVEIVSRQVNDRRESIRMFQQGNRDDLVAKESAELAILESYLPPQLGPDELLQLVRDVVQEVGASTPRDKGRVMGRLMPQVRGRADGTVVNDLVTQLLESGE